MELLDKYSTSESIAIGEYSFDLIADHKELDEEIARYLAEIEAAEKIEIDSLTQRNKAAMDCTRKPTSQRPNQ